MKDFLPFDEIVPLERSTGFYESQLNFVPKRSLIGRTLQGHSVRTITEIEFGDIVRDGPEETLDPRQRGAVGTGFRSTPIPKPWRC